MYAGSYTFLVRGGPPDTRPLENTVKKQTTIRLTSVTRDRLQGVKDEYGCGSADETVNLLINMNRSPSIRSASQMLASALSTFASRDLQAAGASPITGCLPTVVAPLALPPPAAFPWQDPGATRVRQNRADRTMCGSLRRFVPCPIALPPNIPKLYDALLDDPAAYLGSNVHADDAKGPAWMITLDHEGFYIGYVLGASGTIHMVEKHIHMAVTATQVNAFFGAINKA
jgi:hypothetical protein